MKNVQEINDKKVPVIRIDKSLNKYDDIVLFPEKLKKANDMLKNIGLPKTENHNVK